MLATAAHGALGLAAATLVGAIIGNENLKAGESLTEIAVQHLGQPFRLVVGADDDGLFQGTGVGS